jgi:hypothetical protein
MSDPTTPAAPPPDTAPAAPSAPAAAPAAPPPVQSDVALTKFFSTSAAACTAASSLGKSAEVGVTFTDVPGSFRFFSDSGKPVLAPGAAKDPDFDLILAPGAVKAIAARADAEVGDLGILFFQHMIAHAPEDKIRVKLHSGLVRLTMRGWLGVLAHGGPRVVGWMAQKGLKGPGAVAAAISKLKK